MICRLLVLSLCFLGVLAQNTFSDVLVKQLHKINGLDVEAVLDAGASNLGQVVNGAPLKSVRKVFMKACGSQFVMPCVVAGVMLLLSLGMERRRIEEERGRVKGAMSWVL